MDCISRRHIVRGAAATAVATTLGAPAVHAQKDRQILRFVPQAELKILDPVVVLISVDVVNAFIVKQTTTDLFLHSNDVKPSLV